jgi:hypothetical protein
MTKLNEFLAEKCILKQQICLKKDVILPAAFLACLTLLFTHSVTVLKLNL